MDYIKLPNYLDNWIISEKHFLNNKLLTKNGKEYIKSLSNKSIGFYKIKNATLSKNQFEDFLEFFYSRSGSFKSFLLKDPIDYIASRESIFITERTNKIHLKKNYKKYFSYKKDIKYPDLETVKIYKKDSSEITDFIFNTSDNILILRDYLEEGEVIFADFEYFTEVRFCSDKLSYNFADDGSLVFDEIILKEVL